MARNYVQELKYIRAAIDLSLKNGGVTVIETGDFKGEVDLSYLRSRERELESKIRLRRGGGRNVGY